jgi:hypothetical protein
MALAAIPIACTRTLELAAADPYAHCADLGDLSLSSRSRSDAELWMRARVLELGGDTLLFGERGRSGRLRDVPEEIVKRRSELIAVASANAVRRSDAETPTASTQAAPGELWYYGAALRCNR